MKKIYTSVILLLTSCFAYATIWQVGPSHTYTMPSQVSALVQNGDTVDIDAGTYTADVAHWTANNLLLRGVGNGFAHLNANNTSYGRKAIWVLGGNNNKVQYIEFSNCHDVAGLDMNWAGIRQEGMNLTVSHCYFHDNDDGILAGTLNPSKIVIQFTEFDHNGYGDGYSHNLYINHVDTLVFRYNYSHHANIGHELKSRANVNYILYNRLGNETTGNASREMDLPNGGPAVVMGNEIEQGPNSTNSGIVGYGLEGLSNPSPQELYFINNTVVNDKASGTFVSIQSGMDLYKAYNNIFAGPGTVLNGIATVIDTMKNWNIASVSSAGFVNAAGYDYHLTAGSGAINGGVVAGTSNSGFSLTPSLEYSHPANNIVRTISGTIDQGAHEFASTTGITSTELKDEFNFWSSEGSLILVTSLPKAEIIIYDAFGRKISAEHIQSGISSVDIHNLPAGVYFLEARAEGGVVAGKFIR